MRRAHDALGVNAVSVCKDCGEIVRPHNVCKACGSYNGKQIVENASK